MKTIGNILWFIFGGFLSGISWLIAGLLCCITVVGIPLGRQCFKFASLSFWPFGKEIIYGGGAPSTIANLIWILLCGWLMAVENCIFGLLWTDVLGKIRLEPICLEADFFLLVRFLLAHNGKNDIGT